jgi:hypothetical protein
MNEIRIEPNVGAFVSDEQLSAIIVQVLGEEVPFPITSAVKSRVLEIVQANHAELVNMLVKDVAAQVRAFAETDDFQAVVAAGVDDFLLKRGLMPVQKKRKAEEV